MKMCLNCNRIVDDIKVECPTCHKKKFEERDLSPDWDSLEPYLKRENTRLITENNLLKIKINLAMDTLKK